MRNYSKTRRVSFLESNSIHYKHNQNHSSHVASSISSDKVLLEEEIGGIPTNDNDCTNKPIKLTFNVGGKQMTAGSCLRRAMNTELRSETSRISRYRRQVKSGTEIQNTGDDEASDDSDLIYALEQPIATILVSKTKKGSRVVLAIISPSHFKLTRNGAKVTSVHKEKFVEDATVSGSIILAQVTDGKLSWDIRNHRSVKTKVEVEARNCILLNPDQGKEQNGKVHNSLQLSVAETILEKLFLQYELTEKKSVLYEVQKSCSELPYRSGKKEILTLVLETHIQVLSSRSQITEKRNNSGAETQCRVPGCNETFVLKDIRHHASWHIQHDDLLLDKLQTEEELVTTESELCGVCAVFPSITQTAAPPSNRCATWLEKKRGVTHFKHKCRNHPLTKISYKAAMKSSRLAPSTNLPIDCPECSEKNLPQAFYKYNFQNHWDSNHKDIKMPEELKNQINVSEEEKNWLKSFEKAKCKGSKKRQQKKVIGNNLPSLNTNTCTNKQNRSRSDTSTPAALKSIKGSSEDSSFEYSTKQDPSKETMMLRTLSSYDSAAANSIIDHAFNFPDKNICYNFKGGEVKTNSLSKLHGYQFINDELMNVVRAAINDRSLLDIQSNPSSPSKCFVVSSYFMSRLVGGGRQAMGEKQRHHRSEYSKVSLGMKSWKNELYGRGTSQKSLIDMVHSDTISKLIFQVNIPEYHWFAVEVCFKKNEIIAHCSLVHELLNNATADVILSLNEEDNILSLLQLDQDTHDLRKICERIGIKHSSSKETTLQNLYRPMALQEIYGFLSNQNNSQDASKRIEMKGWKLILSSSMPQQSVGSNACALYTSAVSDVLSMGMDIASIDGTQLENEGRTNMAYICCIKYGKKNI